MIVKCGVMAIAANGEPDIVIFVVNCSEAFFNKGDHYSLVKSHMVDLGYETPLLAFDEHDSAWAKIDCPVDVDQLEHLYEYAEVRDFTQEQMDELVRSLKSNEAEEINGRGRKAQLKYIYEDAKYYA